MGDIYTDEKIVLENLVDGDTGDKITIDLSKFTLPQRRQLKLLGGDITKMTESFVSKLYKYEEE